MSGSYTKNIQVFARIQTNKDFNMDYVKMLNDKKTLCVRSNQDFRKNHFKSPHYWIFQTNGIFYNDSQENIYETVTKDVLPSILNGTNLVLIGYGQTGTGKSTTMHGLQSVYRNRGISSRIIEGLLEFKNSLKTKATIELEASCVEVRKDFLIDLLSDERKRIHRPFKKITRLPIKSLNEGYMYLFFSEVNRTLYQNDSYLSHNAPSIFTIYIKNMSLVHSDPNNKYSKIHIIDLSGADTVGNMTCLHKMPREVGESNLVKTQLEQLLLVFNKNRKKSETLRGMGCLVEFLSDSLRPENILRFIAHISTRKENLPITISHLRFNQLAGQLVPAKLISCSKTSEQMEKDNMRTWLQYYIEQDQLKAMILNEDTPSRVTPERYQQMENVVDEFVHNKMDNLPLNTIADTQTVLNIFKDLYQSREAELQKYVHEKSQDSLLSKYDIVISTHTSKLSQLSSDSNKIKRKTHKSSIPKMKRGGSRKDLKQSSSKNLKSPRKSSHQKSISYSSPVNKSQKAMGSRKHLKSKKSSKSTVSSKSQSSFDDPELYNYLKLNVKNYEDVWKTFTQDEGYKDLNAQLRKAANDYLEVQYQYNEVIAQMQNCNQFLDGKRDYLLKIQSYKSQKQFDCYKEEKLDEIENNLITNVNSIKSDVNDLKEQLLAKQAELKIDIDDYHRIKKDIGEYFIKYCREKLNIYLGNGEQNIEDELFISQQKPESILNFIIDDDLKKNEELFNAFQAEMNKFIKENQNK